MNQDLTIDQVAERTQLSRRQVLGLLASGRLRGYKAGWRSWRVPVEALDEFREQAGEEGPAPARRRKAAGDAAQRHEAAMAMLRAEGVIK
jgi:excisionase family DNA binding protein